MAAGGHEWLPERVERAMAKEQKSKAYSGFGVQWQSWRSTADTETGGTCVGQWGDLKDWQQLHRPLAFRRHENVSHCHFELNDVLEG